MTESTPKEIKFPEGSTENMGNTVRRRISEINKIGVLLMSKLFCSFSAGGPDNLSIGPIF